MTYSRPLIEGKPKILLKSENCPIQIKMKFACPYQRCSCSMSPDDRQEARMAGKKVFQCPFRRWVRFADSALFLPSSLSSIISDMHIAREKEGISLTSMFQKTYDFAMSQNLSYRQFVSLTNAKMTMPHEFTQDFSRLSQTKLSDLTDKKIFASILRGTTEATDEEMTIFKENWNILQCDTLLDLYKYYNAVDCTALCDGLKFYFEKIYKITNLYPAHFITLASQALISMTLNVKDPKHKHRTIFLPFLSSDCFDLYEKSLVGGYSVNSCFFSYWNNGYLDKEDPKNNIHEFHKSDDFETVSSGSYLDYNSLYPRLEKTDNRTDKKTDNKTNIDNRKRKRGRERERENFISFCQF